MYIPNYLQSQLISYFRFIVLVARQSVYSYLPILKVLFMFSYTEKMILLYLCIFRITDESGHFSQDGVTTSRSGSIVRCSSNHLTSFAILVDKSGQAVSTIWIVCIW